VQFSFTPDEAVPAALAVAAYLTGEGFRVEIEARFDREAPYRTTLKASSRNFTMLVEAQGAPNYTDELRDLARWLASRHHDAELYVAAPEQGSLTGTFLTRTARDGVGLIVIDEHGQAQFMRDATNPALVVTLDQTLALGRCRSEVIRAVSRFNSGSRKNGLQDICDIFEREVTALAFKAARHGRINKTPGDVEAMNLNSRINILSASNPARPGSAPVVHEDLKTDLHSFRGARNLVDHPARSRLDAARRERQYPERVYMGARLIADLLSLQRKIR
jgi:hypothetical protein